MNFKTKLLILPSLCVLLSTMGIADSEMENYQKLQTASLMASKKINTAEQGKTQSGKGVGEIKDNYMDTVIYNDIHNKTSHGKTVKETQYSVSTFQENGIKLATPETDYVKYASAKFKENAEVAKKEEALKKSLKKEHPKYFVGGYCIATKRVEIIKSSSFTTYDCELQFGNGQFREVQVFGGVYPNYGKEVLVSLPIYATLPNGKRASMSGVIMNVDKTSLNIANEIESFKIRRWVAQYGLTINDIAYKYALMYWSDLRASRQNTQVVYASSTSTTTGVSVPTPIQVTNTEKPNIGETFAIAGVELFSKLMAIGADNLMNSTTPLFTVYKGQRVWLEGVIDTDAEKSFGTLKSLGEEIKKDIKNQNSQFTNTNSVSTTQNAQSSTTQP